MLLEDLGTTVALHDALLGSRPVCATPRARSRSPTPPRSRLRQPKTSSSSCRNGLEMVFLNFTVLLSSQRLQRDCPGPRSSREPVDSASAGAAFPLQQRAGGGHRDLSSVSLRLPGLATCVDGCYLPPMARTSGSSGQAGLQPAGTPPRACPRSANSAARWSASRWNRYAPRSPRAGPGARSRRRSGSPSRRRIESTPPGRHQPTPEAGEPERRRRLVVAGEARQTVEHAREEARQLAHPAWSPITCCWACCGKAGRLRPCWRAPASTWNPPGARCARSAAGRRGERNRPATRRPGPRVGRAARAAFEQSLREAVARDEEKLGPEHLLLALLRDRRAAP